MGFHKPGVIMGFKKPGAQKPPVTWPKHMNVNKKYGHKV